MSQGQPTCWTAVPAGGTLTAQLRDAFPNLRLERGLPMAQDEGIDNGSGGVELRTNPFRIVVWEEQADAQEFATELGSRTRSQWNVVPTQCDPE